MIMNMELPHKQDNRDTVILNEAKNPVFKILAIVNTLTCPLLSGLHFVQYRCTKILLLM